MAMVSDAEGRAGIERASWPASTTSHHQLLCWQAKLRYWSEFSHWQPITIVGSAFADAWEEKEEILSSQNQRATLRSRVESCERLSVPDIARGPSKLQSLGRSSSFLHRPAHTRMSMGGAAFRAAMPNLSEDAEGISRRASDAREANVPPEVSARLASLEAAVKEVQATSQLLQQALLRIEGKLEASSPNSADA